MLQELACILYKAARECRYVNPADVADILDVSFSSPETTASRDSEKGYTNLVLMNYGN